MTKTLLKSNRLIHGKIRYLNEFLGLFRESLKHSTSLTLVQDKLQTIKKNDIVLFSTMKNESHRLPFFLDFYRAMGVNHFIFVDNDSNDGFSEVIENCADVTAYHTKESYKDSNFGMHWINYLLNKHGVDKWCFTCDPDEFFVYPYDDSRNLRDLTEYLDSIRQRSFFTIMVDMYSNKPISETNYTNNQDPLEICPYFDGVGYSKQYSSNYKNLYVQGGVRQRVFACSKPESAPALNKVPLIKWKFGYAYVSSMHMAIPRHLNRCVDTHKVSGALLHYKFIAQLQEKVSCELEAKQHYNDSAEYKQYGAVIEKEEELYDSQVSMQFKDWKPLPRLGLINRGEWK